MMGRQWKIAVYLMEMYSHTLGFLADWSYDTAFGIYGEHANHVYRQWELQ